MAMLDAAASVQDKINLHSMTPAIISTHSNSIHSGSKYDSVFDSHYTEDTSSISSQVITLETGILPSLMTPPLRYCATKDWHSKGEGNSGCEKVSSSPSHLCFIKRESLSNSSTPKLLPLSSGLESILPTLLQPEVVYIEPSFPSPQEHGSEASPGTGMMSIHMPPSLLKSSSESSADTCISNDSTPTLERPSPVLPEERHTPPYKQKPLIPRVRIIYPNDSDSDTDYTPHSPRCPHHPMMFYQESVTPQSSPLHASSHRQTNPLHTSHLLPNRYQERERTSDDRVVLKRRESILSRLIRKQKSFKEESRLKRHFPVRRAFSDRITYHVRKGWIDYKEKVDFISQPTNSRPVARMIDKEEGRFHVIQLYKPPNGRYGIYISERGHGKGVFVSRFADPIAEKFYAGLITPGDQIIRVNGTNVTKDHSVDHVYDLMTSKEFVIFTVIPINSRSDW